MDYFVRVLYDKFKSVLNFDSSSNNDDLKGSIVN